MSARRRRELFVDSGRDLSSELMALVKRERPVSLLVRGVERSRDVGHLLARLRDADPNLRSITFVFEEHESEPSAPHGPEGVLTAREQDVLQFVALGFTNVRIARMLWITPDTVKFHVHNACRKLGADGRVEAARIASERGLLAAVGDGRGAPRPTS